jgi:hypothetical protein
MSSKEKMYDAITGIRDDIVESAGEYGFEKKKRSFAWIGCAAAACLVMGIAAFGISRLNKAPADPMEAAVPTEQASFTAEAPAPEKTVLYCNGVEQVPDEVYPNPGKTNISSPLCIEMLNPEYADCLFAVRIGLTHTYDDIWEELNEAWREYVADPDYQKYSKMYEEWEAEKFKDMLPDEIAAYYGLSYEEFDNRPEHPTRGFILMNTDFQEYLKEALDAEEAARCIEAFERMSELDNEMWGSRARISARNAEVLRSEYERLLALGLDVELGEDGLIGYLSGEQISDFPCSELYGYYISWIGANNIMDE